MEQLLCTVRITSKRKIKQMAWTEGDEECQIYPMHLIGAKVIALEPKRKH